MLDEPTAGIQPNIIEGIQRIIAMLRDLADTFVVMERGEVVLSGQRSDMVEADVRRYLTV